MLNKTRVLQIKLAEKTDGKKYYFLRPVLTIEKDLTYSAIAKDVNNDNSSLLNSEANIIMYDFDAFLNPNIKNYKQNFEEKFKNGLEKIIDNCKPKTEEDMQILQCLKEILENEQ